MAKKFVNRIIIVIVSAACIYCFFSFVQFARQNESLESQNESVKRQNESVEISKKRVIVRLEKAETGIKIPAGYLPSITIDQGTYGEGRSEHDERQKKGYLDGIPLRNLLPLTKFLSLPKNPCEYVIPEMVTLVTSACKNNKTRSAVRETWGGKAASLGIPVVFFVGQCPEAQEEIKKYGDIVEVDFVDSYYNLTLKTLSRYKWYLEFCNATDKIYMSDDDTVVHISYLLEYTRRGIGEAMVGYPISHVPVIRSKNDKWYQPYWSYPYPAYPDYLNGPGYVVNGTVVQRLYEASLDITFITIEDVTFTGIAATRAGIPRIGEYRFCLYYQDQINIECGHKSVFSTHSLSPDQIRSIWNTKLKACGLSHETTASTLGH